MGKARTDSQTAHISILIMQRLLSDGLVIISMHSALLLRNHYEAQVRSLTSFCVEDLWVLTMRGGSEGEEGGEAKHEREEANLTWLRRNGGGGKVKEEKRDDVQFSKIDF